MYCVNVEMKQNCQPVGSKLSNQSVNQLFYLYDKIALQPISYVVKMLEAKVSMAKMFAVQILDPPVITLMRCKMEWTLNKCIRHLIYKRIAINVVAVLPLYFILQISFAKFSSPKLNFFLFQASGCHVFFFFFLDFL